MAESLLIYADVSSLDQLKEAIDNGAQGIGILRTECLYQNARNCSEEEQFMLYREAVKIAGNRPVTIRTFSGFSDEQKTGRWGIRFSMVYPDIFQTQLRAILRAGVNGNVNIALPGISDAEEFKWAKKQLELVKKQLEEQNIKYNKRALMGIMIEIPAVVMCLDMLIHEVNFYIIDSDRLLQNLMVINAGNDTLETLKDPLHPAVLRTIKQIMTARPGGRIKLSVCGRLAETDYAVPILKGMGIKSIAVRAGILSSISALEKSVSKENCLRIASKTLALSNSQRIKNYVMAAIDKYKM